ncbi:ATP-binding protein [Streptomyces sp. NPDC048527]|uniref:ATP-binding protein n=1 Tax=Streptomyces sp. NPDC048527 TaxID=3365568 RepID=UPI00371792AD
MTGNAVEAMVGRAGELATLSGALTDVLAGRGGSLLIEGEAGIGKTTLLRAGLSRLGSGSVEILHGECDDLRQRFPLSVMTQLLGVDPHSPDPRRAQTAQALAQPAAAPDGDIRVVGGDPVMAAVEHLLALVDQLCAAAPVVVTVEDLQWADETSLLLWRRLSRATVQLPLLLIGTCRPVPQRPELQALAQDLDNSDGGTRIALGPLPDTGVSHLAGQLAGGAPGPWLTERLQQTAGNPLYISEFLDVLSRSGALHVRDGIADVSGEDADTAAVTHPLAVMITNRLGFLTPDTREVLRSAALLGPDSSLPELAAVSERSAQSLGEAIREARAAGVLEPQGTRVVFRHGLLRESLCEAIPTALRAALYRHTARVLINTNAPVERIAELILPVPETVDGWELDWLLDNAALLSHKAPGIAEELLTHALERLRPDDARYAPLENQLAAVHQQLGHLDQAERITRGILVRTTDPRRAAQAVWILGYTLLTVGRAEEAAAVVRDALRAGGSLEPRWRARLSALWATVLHRLLRFDEATEATEAALAEGERAADPTAIVHALQIASVLSHQAGDTKTSLLQMERAVALAEDEPELISNRVLMLCNRSAGLTDLDHIGEGAAALRQARTLCEQTGSHRLNMVATMTAERDVEFGRWGDALAELESAADLSDEYLLMFQYGMMALIAERRNDGQSASRHLGAVSGRRAPEGWPWAACYLLLARALGHERAGRPQEALESLAVVLGPEFGQDTTAGVDYFPALVRLAQAAGDHAIAQAAAAACQPRDEHGSIPRALAAAQWCRGLVRRDAELVLGAAEYFRGCGRIPALGNALEDASVLQAAAGDADGARSTLAEALESYSVLGAEWDARRAVARLRPYGVRQGVRGSRLRPKTGPQSLTSTELSVAVLVSKGQSNPAIAGQLLLSRRTVETHVSHILAKLEVRSRRDIAAQLAR